MIKYSCYPLSSTFTLVLFDSRLLYAIDDPDYNTVFYSGPLENVNNGDYVRIYHAVTNTSLAVAKQPALTVKKHRLVYADIYVSVGVVFYL